MYIGSFLTHIGTSLWFKSPAGIFLSFWILAVYLVALKYEGPFTDMIYSAAHKKSESTKRSTESAAAASSGKSTATSTGSTGSSKTTGAAPATPRNHVPRLPRHRLTMPVRSLMLRLRRKSLRRIMKLWRSSRPRLHGGLLRPEEAGGSRLSRGKNWRVMVEAR
jgi:hypothetical protein